jgi:DNA-binding NtrC family response regulator
LAQVHGLVRQHQGFIDVTSQEGVGTCFTIYLPDGLREDIAENFIEDVETLDIVDGDKDMILLVEDESMLRENFADILELLNYRVIKASNGMEALQLYNQYGSAIQLVLTDMVMPKMGGFELCQALRDRDTALPIIAMSGYSTKINTGELRNLNIAQFMQKPVQPEVLSQTIHEILHGSKDVITWSNSGGAENSTGM